MITTPLIIGIRDATGLRIPLDAQLHQLGEGVAEILEEDLLVLGVEVDVLREGGVVEQGHVGREHHQLFFGDGIDGSVLQDTGRGQRVRLPVLGREEFEVLVREAGGVVDPFSAEAGVDFVAAAEVVGAA